MGFLGVHRVATWNGLGQHARGRRMALPKLEGPPPAAAAAVGRDRVRIRLLADVRRAVPGDDGSWPPVGWPVAARKGARVKRLVLLVVTLVSLGLLGPAVARAQEATPTAGTFPITPDPAECQAEARDVEELIGLAAGATPAGGTTEAETVEVPVGVAADAEQVAGVTATTREIFACFNAGDFARALSLVTDDVIRRFGEEDPVSEEELRGFLETTPEAVPAEQQSTILVISDIMELEDGRVGAFVASTDPFVGPDAIYFVFVQEDGRWLVADFIDFLDPAGGGEGGEGTPTA